MKHVAYITILFATNFFSLAGCNRRTDTAPPSKSITAALDGAIISGTVTLNGPCVDDACFACGDQNCQQAAVTAEHWIVRNEKVANAFVYIKDGLGNRTYDPPNDPVILDQRTCVYRPHVVGLVAGQTLKVLNSDQTLHNVHLTSETPSECFNKLFPAGMAPLEQPMKTPGVMKTLKCDVHSWMNCYVGVLPHPFFAVSDSSGHFEIKGVPPGAYTLELWHESSRGTEAAIVQTKKLIVTGKEPKEADFAIEAR